jgi:hypothetical protein
MKIIPSWTWKLINVLLIGVILVLWIKIQGVCFVAKQSPLVNSRLEEPSSEVWMTPNFWDPSWPVVFEDAIGEVHTSFKPGKETVHVKKCRGNVFETSSGHIWAGYGSSIYIETKSEIINVEVSGEQITWRESEAENDPSEKLQLGTVQKQYAERIQSGRPFAQKTYWTKLTGLKIDCSSMAKDPEAERVPWDYVVKKDEDAIRVSGDVLRLDLVGNEPGFYATVWLQISTKRLMMLTQNGRPVFWRPFFIP